MHIAVFHTKADGETLKPSFSSSKVPCFVPVDIECIQAVVKSKFQDITQPPEGILVYRLKENLKFSQVTNLDQLVLFDIEDVATSDMRIACIVSGMILLNLITQNRNILLC